MFFSVQGANCVYSIDPPIPNYPADFQASDVDKKKGRKLDPNEDLRNKGFKAGGPWHLPMPHVLFAARICTGPMLFAGAV